MIDPLTSMISPPSPGVSLPAFRIRAGGVPLPAELLKSCASVSVSLNANQPASFSLEINDPRIQWIGVADGLLQEGQLIDIALGYGLAVQPVIRGTVASVGVELDESGGLLVHVHGFDALHEATRETDYEKFLDEESDALIVQKIARNVLGIARTSIELQGSRTSPRVKRNTTALQFLEELAREYGCSFWIEDDTLFFRPEREGGVRIRLRRRVDLSALSVRLSTAGQVAEVEARAWDTSRKQAIVATARASTSFAYMGSLSAAAAELTARGASGRSRRVLFKDIQASTLEEAQRFADAELRRLRRNLVTGEGSTIGNPAIGVGTVIVIEDVGRFSGEYLVDSVRHDINESGFRTSFEIRRPL